jgi:signal transduction histidine kinase/tetratricopeptide (TPR) repeat protein
MILENRGYVYNAAECYLKTKNLTKAIEVSFNAATFAVEQVAFDVAVRYFKNTQFLLKQCPKINVAPPIDPLKVEVFFGDILMLTGKNEQALKIFYNIQENTRTLDRARRFELNYKIGTIHHNLGKYDKSIPIFKNALEELGIHLRYKRIYVVLLICWEVFVQFVLSIGGRYLVGRKRDSDSLLKLRILNKLSYSLYFEDMLEAFFVHFKALNLADRVINSYEKVETYACHIVPACQMFLKKRSMVYLGKSLRIAQIIKRKDISAFGQSFGGLVQYYFANWRESGRLLTDSIKNYSSIGDVGDQIICTEQLWKTSYLRGRLDDSINGINRTLNLCHKVNEKHFLITALAASNLISCIRGRGVNPQEMQEIGHLLSNVTSFLSQTEVGLFFAEIEAQEDKRECEYKRLTELIPIIMRKNINSEHHVPAFSMYCDLVVKELLGRKKGITRIDVSAAKLILYFHIYSLIHLISAMNYPAHMGSYYRSKAWWHALKNHKKKAHRNFQKAIKAHHSLDMRYEEARSIRDYANFLEDFCNLPGEARDKYNEAYKLFDWCGAKLETDRIKDKVDSSCLQQTEHIVIQGEETTTNPVTSFTTAAGVNQLRVNTLYDLSNSIQNIDDISELLHRILRSMITATGAQFGGLFVGGDENHQNQSLFMDFEGKTVSENSVSYSKTIVEKVRETREVILVRDGVRNRDVAGDLDKDIRSALCVPLSRGKLFHGCVYLGNNMVTGLFSDDSKKTALIIAAEASILLENAYLMDSYKRLNRDLQKKVREQTADIREKNKQLADYNLRIVDSERMKTLLSGTIVHDIKNYAAGIEGNTTLLARQFPGEEKVLKTTRIVTDCCSGIVSLASNMLDIEKMEEGKLVLKKEMLTKNVLFEMAEQLSRNVMFEEKNISVRFLDNTKDMFAIDADFYLMERVMQNLFSNAAKYVGRGGGVVISLEAEGEENILCFFNSGSPIPDEDKSLLFDKYARVESKGSQYSKGLGLFFCKMVMNAHNGRIWLDSDSTGNFFKLAFKKKHVQSMISPAA